MTKTSALTRVAAAALALSALNAPLMAQTAEGPWLVRARALHLSPENGGNVNGLAINDIVTAEQMKHLFGSGCDPITGRPRPEAPMPCL